MLAGRAAAEAARQMWGRKAGYSEGDECRAQLGGVWRTARVATCHADGSFDLVCDDGSTQRRVSPAVMQPHYPQVGGAAELGGTMSDLWGAAPVVGAGAPADPTDLGRERQAFRAREARPAPAEAVRLIIGGQVSADYCGRGHFHAATVMAANGDGSYALLYEDGLREERVPPHRIFTPYSQPASGAGSRRRDRRTLALPPAPGEGEVRHGGAAPGEGEARHGVAGGRALPRVARSLPASPPRERTTVEERRRGGGVGERGGGIGSVGGGLSCGEGGGGGGRGELGGGGVGSRGFFIGERVQGNWSNLGYWHPATISAVTSGGYILHYDDGVEEHASPAGILRPGAAAGPPAGMIGGAAVPPGGILRQGGAEPPGGILRLGAAGAEPRRQTPLAPRRRAAGGVKQSEVGLPTRKEKKSRRN